MQELGKTEWGHVALTVDIETTKGVKKFLLDPTFPQFCLGKDKSPGTFLQGLPEGEDVVKALTTTGFIELTPAAATSYFSAFFNGVSPFPSGEDVMAILSHTNEKDARFKSGLWPPQAYLEKNGWVARPQPPGK